MSQDFFRIDSMEDPSHVAGRTIFSSFSSLQRLGPDIPRPVFVDGAHVWLDTAAQGIWPSCSQPQPGMTCILALVGAWRTRHRYCDMALYRAPNFAAKLPFFHQLDFFVGHLPDAILTLMAAIPAYLFKVRLQSLIYFNLLVYTRVHLQWLFDLTLYVCFKLKRVDKRASALCGMTNGAVKTSNGSRHTGCCLSSPCSAFFCGFASLALCLCHKHTLLK